MVDIRWSAIDPQIENDAVGLITVDPNAINALADINNRRYPTDRSAIESLVEGLETHPVLKKNPFSEGLANSFRESQNIALQGKDGKPVVPNRSRVFTWATGAVVAAAAGGWVAKKGGEEFLPSKADFAAHIAASKERAQYADTAQEATNYAILHAHKDASPLEILRDKLKEETDPEGREKITQFIEALEKRQELYPQSREGHIDKGMHIELLALALLAGAGFAAWYARKASQDVTGVYEDRAKWARKVFEEAIGLERSPVQEVSR